MTEQTSPTGDHGVDQAIGALLDLDVTAPPEQLLGDLTAVHDQLAERLRAVDG